jgi:hypothetical protein
MPNPSERFQSLGHQFDSLVERLNESPTPSSEERRKLLRQMKVLIVEIDMLILSALKRDNQDASSTPSPDHSAADA